MKAKSLSPTGQPDKNLADDLLHGAEEIALFVFGDAKDRWKVYHLSTRAKCPAGRLPVFKLGGTVCARRSTLIQWIAAQEKVA